MMMAFVPAFAAVGLGQPDLAALDAVNGPDMNAVSSDHFHVLFYATLIHFSSLRELALACRRLRASVSQVRPGRSCSLLPSSSRSCLIHPFWFCHILEGANQSVVLSVSPSLTTLNPSARTGPAPPRWAAGGRPPARDPLCGRDNGCGCLATQCRWSGRETARRRARGRPCDQVPPLRCRHAAGRGRTGRTRSCP